jgi:signal transduction histidine kinase
MTPKIVLNKIKHSWLETIPRYLAVREGVRSGFKELLVPFYELLERALETNESAWLNGVLDEWVTSPTETELGEAGTSTVEVVNQILVGTSDVAMNELSSHEAALLLHSILPIFSHAIHYLSSQEIQIRVKHITNELNNAKLVVEKLEESKSDFISVAAHELKTPLTLIDGYSSMLKEALPINELGKEQVDLCLKGIDAGTRRLREIVDDMIDVSLIDNNLLSLSFQPVWLNHILNALQRELDDTIKKRKLAYSINQFSGLNEMFFADGERLYQAIRNVITNAIKYTPDGGSIMISGRSLPGFIELVISDTGIGIDPEDHIRIFEKFGRIGDVALHSSGKTKFKGGGPGLGLPITRGIIESHGGAIWVESEGYDEVKCPGAKFHIMLPLRKSPPDEKSGKFFRNLMDMTKQLQL